MNRPTNKKASSIACLRDHFKLGFSRHKSTKGVTTIAPTPSPNHQVHQMVPYIDQLANPPNAKVVTPTVALTAVLTIPAKNANLKISCALSKKRPLAAKRFTR